MEYLGKHLQLARALFPIDPGLKTGYGRDHLVISIRAKEILHGLHPNYTVLPLAWYRRLIDETRLKPVFLGEIGTDGYSAALRSQFPDADFVVNENPLDDFNMLRTSANVVLSVSSFAWMAAWLSTSAQRIVLPMAGMYNIQDRPDIDLLPVGDERYEYHAFPREAWMGTDDQLNAKISGPSCARRISNPRLFRGMASLNLWATGRLPQGLPLMRDLRACVTPSSSR
jgi:hypothetical protein